jgi:hypothetical protein
MLSVMPAAIGSGRYALGGSGEDQHDEDRYRGWRYRWPGAGLAMIDAGISDVDIYESASA